MAGRGWIHFPGLAKEAPHLAQCGGGPVGNPQRDVLAPSSGIIRDLSNQSPRQGDRGRDRLTEKRKSQRSVLTDRTREQVGKATVGVRPIAG